MNNFGNGISETTGSSATRDRALRQERENPSSSSHEDLDTLKTNAKIT